MKSAVSGDHSKRLLRGPDRLGHIRRDGGPINLVGHGHGKRCGRHQREHYDRQNCGVQDSEGGTPKPVECREPRENLHRAGDDRSCYRCGDPNSDQEQSTAKHASEVWRHPEDAGEHTPREWRKPEGQDRTDDERSNINRLAHESAHPAPNDQEHDKCSDQNIDHGSGFLKPTRWSIPYPPSAGVLGFSGSSGAFSAGTVTTSISRVQNFRLGGSMNMDSAASCGF